jgi:eukaryotic-like serine/threonine-protein kinase
LSFYLRGEWKHARENLDAAYASGQARSAGRTSIADVFGAWTLMYLGEFRELACRNTRLLADADARGDLYTSVQLRASLHILGLAKDEPDAACRCSREAIAQWSSTRFLLQHWHAMCGEAEIELYLGSGARAYERFARDLPAIGKSLLLKCELIRIVTTFCQGRCAVAVPGLRRQRLAEGRRMARRLEREFPPYAAVFASLLSAAVSNAEGNRPAAIASLRKAIGHSDAAHMAMYAAAARYQLGSLLGNEEGRSLLRQGEDAMKAQDVRVPARFAAMYLPGCWGAH